MYILLKKIDFLHLDSKVCELLTSFFDISTLFCYYYLILYFHILIILHYFQFGFLYYTLTMLGWTFFNWCFTLNEYCHLLVRLLLLFVHSSFCLLWPDILESNYLWLCWYCHKKVEILSLEVVSLMNIVAHLIDYFHT